MPDCRLGQLQHFLGDRYNIPGNVPGLGTPEDVPNTVIWVRGTDGAFHSTQHPRHPHCHIWNGALLVFLGTREPQQEIGVKR